MAQLIDIRSARLFAKVAFVKVGLCEKDALLMAENMIWADMRGIDTHGLQRVSWYVKWILEGLANPSAKTRVLNQGSSFILGDGEGGLGQVVASQFCEIVTEKALEEGLCLGLLKNSNDWGCGAWYSCRGTEKGLVGITLTTSIPMLAPWGSKARLFGNNPIACAFPRKDGYDPIVYDGALTPVALGKVMRAKSEGKEIPKEWGFRDLDGKVTCDPGTALKGIIPAIGGYKGIGLALVTNILAGILPGAAHSSSVEIGKRGQFFLFLNPEIVCDPDYYYHSIEELAMEVAEAASEENSLGNGEAMLPGEPEWRKMRETETLGSILYPSSVLESLDRVAKKLEIDQIEKGDQA